MDPKVESARLAFKSGNKARAEALLTTIYAESEKHIAAAAEAQFELGKLAEQSARFAAAKNCFNRAIQLNSGELKYKTALCNLEQNMELKKRGLTKLEDPLKLKLKVSDGSNDQRATIHTELATAYKVAGEFNKAIEQYNESLKLHREALEPSEDGKEVVPSPQQKEEIVKDHFNLAQCYYDKQDDAQAMEHLKQAKVLFIDERKHLDVLQLLCWCYYRQNDFANALSCFESLQVYRESDNGKNSPEAVEGRRNIAWCYHELKQHYHAVDMLKRVIKRNKKDEHRKKRIDIALDYLLLGLLHYDFACKKKSKVEFGRSKKQFKLAFNRQKKVLGAEHVDTKYSNQWIEEIGTAKEKHKKKILLWLFD